MDITVPIYNSKGSEKCIKFVPVQDLPFYIRELVQNGEVYGIYQREKNGSRFVADLVTGREIKFSLPYKIINF